MAKGARASTKKTNNAKLKSRVFGPVETARAERLSAKLLELVSQPKPKQEDVNMELQEESTDADHPVPISEAKEIDGMEVDSASSKAKPKSSKGRVEKRRASSSRKASIVFPKYKNGKRTKGKK